MSATRWYRLRLRLRYRLMLPGFAALAVTLAGCSDGTSPSDESLSVGEQEDISAAVTDETDQSVDAFSVGAVIDPPSALVASALVASANRMHVAARYGVPSNGCATVDASADTDGDGVRDNTTFTFALPACHFTTYRGGSLDLTGAITISDPSPDVAGFAFQLTYDDFKWEFTGPNAQASFSATRNGSRTLTANAGSLALSNQVTVVRTFPVRADATVSHNTLLTFTPAEGSSLEVGEPLPSGTFSKSGTVTFSRNGHTRELTISTITPVSYNAECTAYPRIDGGVVRFTLASGAYLQLTWTACGVAPTRLYVPAGAAT